jgi:hypothetical protein
MIARSYCPSKNWAKAIAVQVVRLKPSFRLSSEIPTYNREEDARHIREALRKAGLPE